MSPLLAKAKGLTDPDPEPLTGRTACVWAGALGMLVLLLYVALCVPLPNC